MTPRLTGNMQLQSHKSTLTNKEEGARCIFSQIGIHLWHVLGLKFSHGATDAECFWQTVYSRGKEACFGANLALPVHKCC